MTKNTLILSISLALFASCGTKTENKDDKKDSTTKEEGNPTAVGSENKNEEKIEAKKLTMEDLAGTWEQSVSAENGGVSGTGTWTLKLMANGNFTKTISTATNMNTMGMPMPTASESGKWSLHDKTVNLGGVFKLEYHEDINTLVNVAEKLSLTRK